MNRRNLIFLSLSASLLVTISCYLFRRASINVNTCSSDIVLVNQGERGAPANDTTLGDFETVHYHTQLENVESGTAKNLVVHLDWTHLDVEAYDYRFLCNLSPESNLGPGEVLDVNCIAPRAVVDKSDDYMPRFSIQCEAYEEESVSSAPDELTFPDSGILTTNCPLDRGICDNSQAASCEDSYRQVIVITLSTKTYFYESEELYHASEGSWWIEQIDHGEGSGRVTEDGWLLGEMSWSRTTNGSDPQEGLNISTNQIGWISEDLATLTFCDRFAWDENGPEPSSQADRDALLGSCVYKIACPLVLSEE